jgi:hypothetical protein
LVGLNLLVDQHLQTMVVYLAIVCTLLKREVPETAQHGTHLLEMVVLILFTTLKVDKLIQVVALVVDLGLTHPQTLVPVL